MKAGEPRKNRIYTLIDIFCEGVKQNRNFPTLRARSRMYDGARIQGAYTYIYIFTLSIQYEIFRISPRSRTLQSGLIAILVADR